MLLGGLALGGLGAGLEMAGSAADQRAISEVERQTQAQLQKDQERASGVFQQNLAKQGAAPAQADIASGAAQRNALAKLLQQAAQPATTSSPVDASTPTGAAAAREATTGNAWSDTLNRAQSQQGGYGDWATALDVGNKDTAGQLGVINNLSRGTARLLPLEVQVASHKGDALSSWGSLISALGSAAAMGGATGAFGPAVDANGVPLANDTAALQEFNFGR